ncbi:MAG: WD40 repeat domain-containing protein [Planctomycetales bacterium]|nr:WD40 repeat domain-containing protein [Planctomycetales bacterium]
MLTIGTFIMPPETIRVTQTVAEPVVNVAGWQRGWLIVNYSEKVVWMKPLVSDDWTVSIQQISVPAPEYFTDLAVQPEGNRVLTSGHMYNTVWSSSFEPIHTIDGRIDRTDARRQRISRDGNQVLLARRSFDKDSKEIWDLHWVDLTTKATKTLNLGNDSHGVVGMAWSGDRKLAVLTHHQGRIDFISVPDLQLIQSLNTEYGLSTEVNFTHDGRYVGILAASQVVIFDCQTRHEVWKWSANKEPDERFFLDTFDFSPDGKRFYVGFVDFPANTTHHITCLSIEDFKPIPNGFPNRGISHSPLFGRNTIHVSPDGEWIATVGSTPAATEVSFSRPAAFNVWIHLSDPEVPPVDDNEE